MIGSETPLPCELCGEPNGVCVCGMSTTDALFAQVGKLRHDRDKARTELNEAMTDLAAAEKRVALTGVRAHALKEETEKLREAIEAACARVAELEAQLAPRVITCSCGAKWDGHLASLAIDQGVLETHHRSKGHTITDNRA